MKILFRRSNSNDINEIYDCHKECFEQSDHWYKSAILQFIDSSFVIEIVETKKIIGIMLQGTIIPCDPSDDFIPLNDDGIKYKELNKHININTGITMLCIHPLYRNKGLAKKLIELHSNDYKNETVCLSTRKSNNAYNLYLKMGYNHIGTIKDKYYFPTEDCYFLVKSL